MCMRISLAAWVECAATFATSVRTNALDFVPLLGAAALALAARLHCGAQTAKVRRPAYCFDVLSWCELAWVSRFALARQWRRHSFILHGGFFFWWLWFRMMSFGLSRRSW